MSNPPVQPGLLTQLQSAVPQELYSALEPLFISLDHRVETTAAQVASTQASIVSATDISKAFKDALTTTPITMTSPPASSSAHTLHTRTASIKAELPLFRGRDSDDVRTWTIIIEDYLTAQHISLSDWVPQVSVLLRDDAMRWYVSLKKRFLAEAADLGWDELKREMMKKYDSPLRVESLRTELRNLQYKGNMSKYCELFRSLESQIPAEEMTFGDRLAHFLTHLSPDLARDVRREKPTNVEEMYYSA
jgi:Retrotransposon gag protein